MRITSVLVLLYSCAYGDQDKKTGINSSFPTSPAKEATPVVKDTISFDNLSKLLSFFQKKLNDAEAAKSAARRERKSNDPLSTDFMQHLDSIYYNLMEERSNSIYKFLEIKGNSAESFEGLKYLVIDWTFPLNLIDSIFRQFPTTLQHTGDGKWLLDRIEKRKVSEIRSAYNLATLDSQLYNTVGNKVSLKEITSKYILLDFWASWCTPCRYENRVLRKKKSLIERGGDITIVGISLDDNKEKWLDATKKDSLNYLNLCDYAAFDSPVAKEFGVTSIPYNVLITKNGKILANNLWGNRLTEFIKSLP